MADLIRSLALRVLWQNYGRFYSWGGDDPSSFDCSGLVIEVLKSVGRFPRSKDDTANGLMGRYHEIPKSKVEPGCLVFWKGASGAAYHVEMVVQVSGDQIYSMGASGGGSGTLTKADAIKQNAFVKVRPTSSRGSNVVYADPFK